MIISISPHIITQNAKKVKGFFKKYAKNIGVLVKKMLERGETDSKTEKNWDKWAQKDTPTARRGG